MKVRVYVMAALVVALIAAPVKAGSVKSVVNKVTKLYNKAAQVLTKYAGDPIAADAALKSLMKKNSSVLSAAGQTLPGKFKTRSNLMKAFPALKQAYGKFYKACKQIKKHKAYSSAAGLKGEINKLKNLIPNNAPQIVVKEMEMKKKENTVVYSKMGYKKAKKVSTV